MKAADTKIVKGVREFLSDILPDVKDCLISLEFGINNVLKNKNQEKISFSFNFTVGPDNLPGIFNEPGHLEKMKSGLSKRIKKEIRYLKVFWSYQDDVTGKAEQPCCVSFEVKF